MAYGRSVAWSNRSPLAARKRTAKVSSHYSYSRILTACHDHVLTPTHTLHSISGHSCKGEGDHAPNKRFHTSLSSQGIVSNTSFPYDAGRIYNGPRLGDAGVPNLPKLLFPVSPVEHSTMDRLLPIPTSSRGIQTWRRCSSTNRPQSLARRSCNSKRLASTKSLGYRNH